MPTRNIAPAFAAGIREHCGIEFQVIPPICTQLFHMENSTAKFEDYQFWENYGSPTRKNPGSPVTMMEARPSYSKRFTHDTYAGGDVIPDEDWDDDKYGVLHRLLPAQGGGMGRSFKTFYDIQHALMFINLGFATGTNVAGSPDGLSLFNTAHPISAGNPLVTYSNRPSVDVDLSISSYQAAATNIRTQKEPNNFSIIDNEPARLTTHPSLRYVAKQILKGEWERGTADRNTNYIATEGCDHTEWKYFTKSGATGVNNAWFVEGDTHWLYSFLRNAYEVDSDHDIYILAHVWVAFMRFSFGWVDARGTYGSIGS
jgi:hypothetical protein